MVWCWVLEKWGLVSEGDFEMVVEVVMKKVLDSFDLESDEWDGFFLLVMFCIEYEVFVKGKFGKGVIFLVCFGVLWCKVYEGVCV